MNRKRMYVILCITTFILALLFVTSIWYVQSLFDKINLNYEIENIDNPSNIAIDVNKKDIIFSENLIVNEIIYPKDEKPCITGSGEYKVLFYSEETCLPYNISEGDTLTTTLNATLITDKGNLSIEIKYHDESFLKEYFLTILISFLPSIILLIFAIRTQANK